MQFLNTNDRFNARLVLIKLIATEDRMSQEPSLAAMSLDSLLG